jgi:hypothetical protein
MGGGCLYSGPAQRRLIRVRSPMAPQDTPERGAKASRHRRPTLYSGDPAGVSKHPPNGNGDGFAAARLGAGYSTRTSRDSDADPIRFRKAIDAYRPDHPKRSKTKVSEQMR